MVKCRHLIAASQIEVAVLVQCGVMLLSWITCSDHTNTFHFSTRKQIANAVVLLCRFGQYVLIQTCRYQGNKT